jgi:two-component system sensor histidine kinase MprB
MSLRLRLTLLYMGLMLPALVAFSIVVYLIASKRLYTGLDDGLITRVQTVRALLPTERPLEPGNVRTALAVLDQGTTVDLTFKVVDQNGRLLYASGRSAVSLPGPSQFRNGPDSSITWGNDENKSRVAYEPIRTTSGADGGYVVAAVPLRQTDAALEELQATFAVGVLLILLMTGGPAYLLAGRALQPVRQVSQRAAEIERTGDFQRQLPPSGSGDTAELVQTFNAMIVRVHRMLLSQRDFLANSSHELRRPLTVIRTYIDVLEDPRLSEDERTASLQEMREEAEMMSKLIADLLLISREGEQAMARGIVDLPMLCSRLYARLCAQDTAHRYSFSTQGEGRVVGDAERLEQMVSNLLENAAQNTPERGDIGLAVERENGTVRIRVTDNGAGIPEDEQPRVFERFFRGSNAQATRSDGYGLGLVIVKHVAESHGGHAGFHSRPGAGSSFVVELPALEDGEKLPVH